MRIGYQKKGRVLCSDLSAQLNKTKAKLLQ